MQAFAGITQAFEFACAGKPIFAHGGGGGTAFQLCSQLVLLFGFALFVLSFLTLVFLTALDK